jgi:hypothetical protein
MVPKVIRVFFTDRIDEREFFDHCTIKLCASIVEGDSRALRWRGEAATVWAHEVCATLAGDFSVPEDVTTCLGATPQSAIVLELGEHPSSDHAGILVAMALMRQWIGCSRAATDPAVLSSNDLTDILGDEQALRSLFGGGSAG